MPVLLLSALAFAGLLWLWCTQRCRCDDCCPCLSCGRGAVCVPCPCPPLSQLENARTCLILVSISASKRCANRTVYVVPRHIADYALNVWSSYDRKKEPHTLHEKTADVAIRGEVKHPRCIFRRRLLNCGRQLLIMDSRLYSALWQRIFRQYPRYTAARWLTEKQSNRYVYSLFHFPRYLTS